MTVKRLVTLGVAGLVFAIAISAASAAMAFPTRTTACTNCHGVDPTVIVTATQTSNNGTTATYNVSVSDTWRDGVTSWAVFDGATKLVGAYNAGTFSVPVGKTYKVYGVAGAGGLASNSINISPVAPAPPQTTDTTPPTVVLSSPAGGSVVSGPVSLAAIATDASSGVNRVEFRVDGVLVGSDTALPYGAAWDSSAASVGSHTIQATAYDNVGLSAVTSVIVSIAAPVDTLAPSVAITSPADGATVAGSVGIAATASDNSSVARVEFRVDGILVGSDTASPYAASWDASAASPGAHVVEAKAFDVTGNSSAAVVSVLIAETPTTPADTTAPTVAITAPSEGAAVTGSAVIAATATDDTGVARVDFKVDGVLVGSDTLAPFSATWDCTGAAIGSHAIEAVAFDAAGNSASAVSHVSVEAPPLPPTVDGTATVRVSVFRSSTRSLSEARVRLTNAATGQVFSRKASDRGTVRFSNVPFGTYMMSVTKEHYAGATSTVTIDSTEESLTVKLVRSDDEGDHTYDWYRSHVDPERDDD